jgi:hypothetical protein
VRLPQRSWYEDHGQDLTEILVRRSCGDAAKILFKRSLRDIVEVLVIGLVEILVKSFRRFLREDLEDAMY